MYNKVVERADNSDNKERYAKQTNEQSYDGSQIQVLEGLGAGS